MSSQARIKKAVFPVAGLGTRFLPATKASPKEMMPIVDKPLIQYAVEEALSIGVQELIFVTSSSKRAIEDHFDINFELEYRLKEQKKEEILEAVRSILPKDTHCIYIRQSEPLGLGHAVLCAESVVGDAPFAVLLADDLIDAPGPSCLQQMLALFSKTEHSVLAVQKVSVEMLYQYGVIKVPATFNQFGPIAGIVEKPEPQKAPSTFGVVGRYILNPTIFKYLKQLESGAQREVQLTDAIQLLLAQESVQALQFTGKRYDCGTKLGYLEAIVEYGLKHPVIGNHFKECLKGLSQNF